MSQRQSVPTTKRLDTNILDDETSNLKNEKPKKKQVYSPLGKKIDANQELHDHFTFLIANQKNDMMFTV